MENKINIAELLKDCPKGMELDCVIYDDITLFEVDDPKNTLLPIKVLRPDGCKIHLTKCGQYADTDFSKCVIFPKGKTTWEGFHRPYINGDVIVDKYGAIAIYKQVYNSHDEYLVDFHCGLTSKNRCLYIKDRDSLQHCGEISSIRFATEEEKAELFDTIKAKGYKWNEETKTLEKLITPNKFDIDTLKPFDKVLVRNTNKSRWCGQFYMSYDENEEYLFECTYDCWRQCIPYKGNEYLLGTTDDCDNYYKTW